MLDAPYILAGPYPALERARVLGSHIILAGTAAGRPPAGLAGRLFFATDTNGGTLYRDDGASWVQVADAVTQTGGFISAYKPADTSRNTTTTLTADADLSITLAASTKYHLHVFLSLATGAAVEGFKWDLNGGAATINAIEAWQLGGYANTYDVNVITRVTSLTAGYFNSNGGASYGIQLDGYIDVNAGGTLIVRWAQSNSGGTNTTLRKGSLIEARAL